MIPKFSIITPTLNRDSLVRCCERIDQQTIRDQIQHIVTVDCEDWNLLLMAKIAHPQRSIFKCSHPHRNFGNTCRHEAWKYAVGEFVWYIDDDNFLADNDVAKDIADVLSCGKPDWAIFPILRHGQVFFNDPPGLCKTDTANMVIKREIAQWPNRDEYTLDGIFCEELVSQYPYRSFPEFRPIAVVPYSLGGK